jgi:hypothetical protein
MESFFFYTLLIRILFQLPVLIVLLGGIVLALVNRQKYPRAAWLAVFGLSILFVRWLLGTVLNGFLPLILQGVAYRTASGLALITGIIDLVMAILGAVAYGLMIAAIFAGRQPQQAADIGPAVSSAG